MARGPADKSAGLAAVTLVEHSFETGLHAPTLPARSPSYSYARKLRIVGGKCEFLVCGQLLAGPGVGHRGIKEKSIAVGALDEAGSLDPKTGGNSQPSAAASRRKSRRPEQFGSNRTLGIPEDSGIEEILCLA